MSEDETEVRTSEEECICGVVAEACYACGGTPDEFEELIESDPYLSEMYHKEPYFFKGVRIYKEDDTPFHESTDIYY